MREGGKRGVRGWKARRRGVRKKWHSPRRAPLPSTRYHVLKLKKFSVHIWGEPGVMTTFMSTQFLYQKWFHMFSVVHLCYALHQSWYTGRTPMVIAIQYECTFWMYFLIMGSLLLFIRCQLRSWRTATKNWIPKWGTCCKSWTLRKVRTRGNRKW